MPASELTDERLLAHRCNAWLDRILYYCARANGYAEGVS